MKKNEIIGVGVILVLICFVLFYKVLLKGYIPFPGDLLIAEYSPWKYYTYLGYNPGSFPNKGQYFDVIRQLYPWKTVVIKELLSGHIPFWNPYNFSGSPLLANSQSAVFYPFTLIYLMFPQVVAWTVTVMLQPLLAFLFTYIYTRKIGISNVASLFSSIAFSCSLYMSVFLEYNTFGHAILWLPLLLYSCERLAEKVEWRSVIVFLIGIVACATAGHLQLFGFVFIFSVLYLLVKVYKHTLTQKIVIGSIVILSLLSSSFQLFPTYELIQSSARVNQEYAFLKETLLIQPYQLILFFSPDIFGNPATKNYLISDTYPGNALYLGLIPFLFSIVGIVFVRKNKSVLFFSIVSLLLFIVLVRTPISELLYRFNIPFISSGSPNNAMFLLSFSLSILAGFGIDYWINNKNNKKIYIIIGSLLLIFLLQVGFLFVFFKSFLSIKNALYTSFLFLVMFIIFTGGSLKAKKYFAAIALIAVTFLDLFYFFIKFNSFVPSSLVFPKAEVFDVLAKDKLNSRFWGYGAANIQANFATQFSLFSPEGYDPLYPKIYGEFIQGSVDGKIHTVFNNRNRSDAQIAPGDLSSEIYKQKILNILGVKYVIDRTENGSTEDTFPVDIYNPIYQKDGWKIFENNQALPRVFLASSYNLIKTNEEFNKVFFNSDFDMRQSILLNQKPRMEPQIGEGHAEIVSYLPEKVVIKTRASVSKLLFLSDTYYPGWVATIDSQKTPIYKANYAFRAISVPPGNHTVEFIYIPQSFLLGIKTSIISVGILIFITFINSRYYRKEKKHGIKT